MEVDSQQTQAAEQAAQPQVTNLQLSILATIKTAQLQNGLKHGVYSRYRWVHITATEHPDCMTLCPTRQLGGACCISWAPRSSCLDQVACSVGSAAALHSRHRTSSKPTITCNTFATVSRQQTNCSPVRALHALSRTIRAQQLPQLTAEACGDPNSLSNTCSSVIRYRMHKQMYGVMLAVLLQHS